MYETKSADNRTWSERPAEAKAGQDITTTRAIAIATGAATLAGGISALLSRRPADPPASTAGQAVGDAADAAVGAAHAAGERVAALAAEGAARGGDVRDQARRGLRSLKGDVREQSGSGKDALDKVKSGKERLGRTVGELRDAGGSRISDGYDSVREGSQRGGQRIAGEAGNLSGRLEGLAPARLGPALRGKRLESGELAAGTAESLTASLATATEKVRQSLSGTGSPVTRAVESRAKGIGEGLMGTRDRLAANMESGATVPIDAVGTSVREGLVKLRDDVSPMLREAAVQAAARAIELWDAGRQEAQGTLSGDAVKHVSDKAAALTSRAKETGLQVASRAGGVAQETSAELAARTAETRERLHVASRHATTATAETSKEAGSALVWAAIAGGVVYYALLDEQRREQLNRYATTFFAGTRELVRDIQGYDADF